MKIQLDNISKEIHIQGYPYEVSIAKNALIAFLEENNTQYCAKNTPYTYEDC